MDLYLTYDEAKTQLKIRQTSLDPLKIWGVLACVVVLSIVFFLSDISSFPVIAIGLPLFIWLTINERDLLTVIDKQNQLIQCYRGGVLGGHWFSSEVECEFNQVKGIAFQQVFTKTKTGFRVVFQINALRLMPITGALNLTLCYDTTQDIAQFLKYEIDPLPISALV